MPDQTKPLRSGAAGVVFPPGSTLTPVDRAIGPLDVTVTLKVPRTEVGFNPDPAPSPFRTSRQRFGG